LRPCRAEADVRPRQSHRNRTPQLVA
jgi:hypothetical protein